MRPEPHYNYLRTCRKRLGLSEKELAYLLGDRSGSRISRHEHGIQRPTLLALLAYELIYDISIRDIFRELARERDRTIGERSRSLLGDTPPGHRSGKRREALLGIITRSGPNP